MTYSEVANGVPFKDGQRVFAYFSSDFPCIEGEIEEITYCLKGKDLICTAKIKNFAEPILGQYIKSTEEELLAYLEEGIKGKKIILD